MSFNNRAELNTPHTNPRPTARLALDTSFSRHRGKAPPAIALQNNQPIGLLLNNQSLADHARARSAARHTGRKNTANATPPRFDSLSNASHTARGIPIGIALPSPSAPTFAGLWTHSPPPISASPPSAGIDAQKLPTPTIIITPAREDFPDTRLHAPRRRPSSSVYSRYTDYTPALEHTGSTPPVPVLPASFHDGSAPAAPKFAANNHPMFQGIGTTSRSVPIPITNNDDQLTASYTPGLPTPRRSNGWWNLITSPFSAVSTTFPGKSPKVDSDREPIIGSRETSLRSISTGRSLGGDLSDDTPRSAPAIESSSSSPVAALRRSDTAPGALPGSTPEIDIYNVPTDGESTLR